MRTSQHTERMKRQREFWNETAKYQRFGRMEVEKMAAIEKEVAKTVSSLVTQVLKEARDNETIAKFGECPYYIEDLIESKTHKPDKEILTNLTSLMKYKAEKLESKDIGNKVIYKFFIKELMKCAGSASAAVAGSAGCAAAAAALSWS